MTSTADTPRHPDVSEISDLAEGVLSASRAADLRQHLDQCTLCADVEASLSEIRDLLGTLPGPHRMPAEVAGRIDAALAAEALLDSTAPEEAANVSRETAPGAPPTEAATHVTADRPDGHPRAATGPGRNRQAKRRRRSAVLGAMLGTAALGLGALLLQPGQSSDSERADSGAADMRKSGTEFSEPALKEQVQNLLAKEPMSKGKTADGVPSLESEPNAPMRGTDVSVPPCIQKGTGSDAAPIAAQKGQYNGDDAFLVVLPHGTDPTRVQAVVVDAACVGAATPAKGEILLTQVYPRG